MPEGRAPGLRPTSPRWTAPPLRGTIPKRAVSREGDDMRKWYKLDNAAKVFPSVTSDRSPSVFRVSAILDAPIDGTGLRRAVDATLIDFPSLAVRLRTGLFWNYLDQSGQGLTVREETDYPCRAPHPARNGGSLVLVLYHRHRVSVEASHSVTDGGGATEFLKAILARYLTPPDECREEGARAGTGGREGAEDSFKAYCDGTKEKKAPEPDAFRIRGTRFEPYGHHVTHGILDSSRVHAVAKEKGVTVTAYLAALLAHSIYGTDEYRDGPTKPVIVSIPVNLRKAFPSRTIRNFFCVVNVGGSCSGRMELDELAAAFGRELREKTSRESLLALISANMRLERNEATRWVPVHLKSFIIRQVFRFWAERKKTITLSNLGNVELPANVASRVRHLEFVLYPTPLSPVNCGVCSLNGRLTVSFTRTIEENDCIARFFSRLAKGEGLDVSVYANDWGMER